MPDDKYGEELMAWIIMNPGAKPLTQEDIQKFAEGQLAHHKIPRYVHIVDSYPMTISGKVRKVAMREEAVKLLGIYDRG